MTKGGFLIGCQLVGPEVYGLGDAKGPGMQGRPELRPELVLFSLAVASLLRACVVTYFVTADMEHYAVFFSDNAQRKQPPTLIGRRSPG